jgi:hypothetical protein
VLANDFVIAITKAALGTGVKNGFYSGNTAVPGGHARQPVHPDVAQIWPNLSVATPPFGLVVNVPLVDMDARNGSTEIWPGTHRDTTYSLRDGSIRIPETVLEARRAVRPPLQPTVSAWRHRDPRHPFVARRNAQLHGHAPPHARHDPLGQLVVLHGPLRFPKGAEELLAHPDLHTVADFVDEPIEYLRNNQAYDFRK